MVRNEADISADNAAVISRLTAVLENPDFSDLPLLSERECSNTPAATRVLASCSKVFLQMLTGPFVEGAERGGKQRKADSGAAEVGPTNRTLISSFSCEVLSAVLEFAATNNASLENMHHSSPKIIYCELVCGAFRGNVLR